jgi:CubicO group peptidase (beta-lactamase class C family)
MSGGPEVRKESLYDLASVTKPFVATAALLASAKGLVSLDERADKLLGEVRGGPVVESTLAQILSHRGGFSAWGGLYLDVPHALGSAAARRWIVTEAARRRETDAPPGQAVYSDLGYIVAGAALARSVGKSLDRLVEDLLTAPLGVAEDVFYAGPAQGARRQRLTQCTAATERCTWRGRVLRGEVHDENCAALGGVGGHAGLFGTARGVATLGRAMLDARSGRPSVVPKALVEAALAPQPGGTYRLGWDTKTAGESLAGKRLSTESFGHWGFTGTSIWCDPQRDLVVVLLTNRVHPSRANQKIRGFRPAFHDAIVAAIDR